MKEWAKYFSKYTSLTPDEIEEAFEAVQDDIREDLEDYFYSTCEVETDSADDGVHYIVHADEFFEMLFNDYKVEPK